MLITKKWAGCGETTGALWHPEANNRVVIAPGAERKGQDVGPQSWRGSQRGPPGEKWETCMEGWPHPGRGAGETSQKQVLHPNPSPSPQCPEGVPVSTPNPKPQDLPSRLPVPHESASQATEEDGKERNVCLERHRVTFTRWFLTNVRVRVM